MELTKFKIIVDAITYIAVIYGGYFAFWKAVKEYFLTRVAEADRRSQALQIQHIIEELKDIQKFKNASENGAKVFESLLDNVIENLNFMMQTIIGKYLPQNKNKEQL